MSGQPPYWGALPPPAVVVQRQASVRRNSYNANRKAQLPDDKAFRGLYDSPYPTEARPARANRESQQSNATEFTENSFASPRDAEFNRGGLAPRPASYQSQPYNREAEERRRRRASRQQAEERAEFEQRGGIAYDGGVTSSGPIKSNGNGHGPPPNRQSNHRQTQSQDRTPLREPEDFYRGSDNRYKPQRGPLSVDTNLGHVSTTGSRSQQQQAADDAERGIRRRSIQARKEKPEIRSAVEDTRARRGSSRRVSEVSQEGFTSDKSPLQALEANYTKLKEEKRAKAQEAERQIRGRQASGASTQSTKGAQNTVHFDGYSEQATKTVPQRAVVEDVGQDISPTTTAPNRHDSQRKPSALSHPLEDRPSQRKLQKDPPSAIQFSPQSAAGAVGKSTAPQKVPTVIEPGVQRNASFRERAAVGPEIILGTTAEVRRGNTNKLKKNPPGDPWRLNREDIEAQAEEIARTRRAEREQQRMATGGSSGGPLGSSPIDQPPQQMMSGGSGRSHANTKKQREALYEAAQPLHPDEDEATVNMQSMKRSVSQRKAEQLLGAELPFQRPNPDIRRAISPAEQQLYADRLDHSEELGPDGHGDIYGMIPAGKRQNVPISAITGDNISDGEYEQARGADGRHHFSNIIRGGRGNYRPGAGFYQPDIRLDEWKSAGIASLTGALLDLDTNAQAASAAQLEADKDKAWWEAGNTGKRRPSTGASERVRAAEAFGGDMSSEGNNVPTTFTPKLHLKCGPLLRYTGIRRETVATRPGQPKRKDREIWRGSVMIVTTDAASDYHSVPTLKLFKQPRSLLPPPPETLASGEELLHEYIDPIANHPKCGRDGQTLYVKPVEFLPEEKDLSRDESDRGIFSRIPNNSYPTTSNQAIDGEKKKKDVSVRGFRLHTERGATFWRFNIEVELTSHQQRIAYRINGGPAIGFWVPALEEGMNIMNYSCNGFSMSVNSDMFSGPDPLWRDVLNNHQTRPFHVMIGGGDQVYNDCVMRETSVFAEWLAIKNPLHKHNAPFTKEMQEELEDFYLERYAMWFSQGLFSLANSQIPMVNLWDDHDIIDGFGSYPHHFMDSPVFTGLGAIAFKYYMLFQHQSSIDEGPANEPSWLLGTKPGPYIRERSRSLFMSLGGGLSFLGLDCRTERTRDEILSEQTYDAILDRCYAELVKGTTTHLIVLLGVPIAYPRLVWLENILTSRIMDPIKALSRAGAFGNLLNNFDGGVEILDDLDDHWTAKNHKAERRFLIQDLQDLAASKSVRVTILSGDVHLAAIGQFFSSGGADGFGKGGQVPKDKDHRYMPNVISSAIVNTPPPDMLADVLARRDKVHHLDGDTDENMIPLFGVDVDGKKRNNKVMLPRRNWASIRVYDGSGSPPGTPGASRNPSPEKGGGLGGLVRRLSITRSDSFSNGPRRNDSFGPRPPISGGGGGLLHRLSTSRGRPPAGTFDGADAAPPPRRSSSTGGIGGLMRRLSLSRNRPPKRRDRGGINGYDSDSEEEYRPYRDAPDIVRTKQGTFLRGGAMSDDEEEYNPTRLRGGGAMTRSEEAIEAQHGYFPPKKGYRRGEDAHDSDGGTATPPPIRTGMRGTPEGAPITRSNTFADSRHASIAQGALSSRDGLQRSNTTNELRKSMHRTPTGLSAKGGIFGRKNIPEPVNLEGGLEITLNVEVNRKDPAGITAPYRLLVPRLWYEEPIRPGGDLDGAMETPPLQRNNSFSADFGGLMRRLSTKNKVPTQQELERDHPAIRDVGEYQDPRVDDRMGDNGLQRKQTVTDRFKGVFGLGLGRRRSNESHSGTGSESEEDPHADSRLVPLAKYGKKTQIKKENIGKPMLNPGPALEDEDELSRAPPPAPAAPQAPLPPPKPTAYRNGRDELPRTVYRDLSTEAALGRRSLDRPQGVQRGNSLSAKLKSAMGLGTRDSVDSYTGKEHDDTYDTTQGQVGSRPSQQQTRQSIDRGAQRPQEGMKRGNSLGGGLKKALGLGRRDSVESFTGSERSYDEPALPPFKQTAPARETRGPYPSLQPEKQQRGQSLDRPHAGIQRRNTLTDKLKGVVGLGRRDSYSGSEVETYDISPHNTRRALMQQDPPRPPRPPRTHDTRALPPSQRQSLDTTKPQQGPRKSSLGDGLKNALGLGSRDSYSDHSYSEDDESHLESQPRNNAAGQRATLPQAQPPQVEKRYPPQAQAQRQSLDTGRPQQGPRKGGLGEGLKKAMGLGRQHSYSDHSYSEDDESHLEPGTRNNAAGQRIPQKIQPPPTRASLDRPAGHQRKSSLGGGLAKAIGLGGRREEYDSQAESDDESIAGRQAEERAAATGDRRYPSLPQGPQGSQARPPPANMPRQSLDRRDSGRNRVDSGPLPVKRKGMGGGLAKMIGLGRKDSFGSRSGSERSWSEGEKVGAMPRGDESRVTDAEDAGDRRFRKVSGTKVERGAPVAGGGGDGKGVGPLKEGQSGFTRQERQRRKMEEQQGEMDMPGPAR